MGLTFSIENHSAEVIKALEAQKGEALQAAGGKAAEIAQGLCPVDTGRLRSSIGCAVEGDSASIGSDVEYAAAVELGTRRQHPRPFLTPAVESNGSELVKIIEEKLRE